MRARTKTDSPFCAACHALEKEKDSAFCRYHQEAGRSKKRTLTPQLAQVSQREEEDDGKA